MAVRKGKTFFEFQEHCFLLLEVRFIHQGVSLKKTEKITLFYNALQLNAWKSLELPVGLVRVEQFAVTYF